MTTALFWFRRDLRVTDNVGLHHARTSADRLITAFVVDSSHREWKHRCGDRLAFKLQCLESLRETIREQGAELVVLVGRAPEVLPDLCRTENVDRVVWNRSYEPYERRRDENLTESRRKIGVGVDHYKGQVLFEREEILTNEGTPYQVFTYYVDKWKSRPKPDPVPEVQSVGQRTPKPE